MGIYLKKFNINSEYEQYINSSDIILPNVSLIVETNEVYFNNVNNADFIIKYAVDTDDPVQLYFYNDEITGSNPFLSYGVDAFNNIEIDGVNVSITDLDENKGKYAFTSGEHTVKYILKNQLIGVAEIENQYKAGAYFATCNNIKDVIMNISNGSVIFGASIFASCANLTSVTISDSVTSIGKGAFAYCSSLTSINIPDSVTTIDAAAFSASGLTSIVIPDSVTNISGGSFYNCSNLVSVTVNSITPPTLYAGSAPGEPMYPGSFDNCSSDLKIYVPAESVETYKATEGWSSYADIILPIE